MTAPRRHVVLPQQWDFSHAFQCLPFNACFSNAQPALLYTAGYTSAMMKFSQVYTSSLAPLLR